MLGLNPKLKKAFRNNEQDAEVILFGNACSKAKSRLISLIIHANLLRSHDL